MKEMGMTDKQFNGFIRFLIDDLKEVREEKDEEKKNKRVTVISRYPLFLCKKKSGGKPAFFLIF